MSTTSTHRHTVDGETYEIASSTVLYTHVIEIKGPTGSAHDGRWVVASWSRDAGKAMRGQAQHRRRGWVTRVRAINGGSAA